MQVKQWRIQRHFSGAYQFFKLGRTTDGSSVGLWDQEKNAIAEGKKINKFTGLPRSLKRISTQRQIDGKLMAFTQSVWKERNSFSHTCMKQNDLFWTTKLN